MDIYDNHNSQNRKKIGGMVKLTIILCLIPILLHLLVESSESPLHEQAEHLFSCVRGWFADKENWEKLIIPVLAPVITIFGALWVLKEEFRIHTNARREAARRALFLERKSVEDNLDLAIVLGKGFLKSMDDLAEGVSFARHQNITLSVFTNEPLMLLNTIPKVRMDDIFDRHNIKEEKRLLTYANFLIARVIVQNLYREINNWSSHAKKERKDKIIQFENALTKFLDYIENEIYHARLNKEIVDAFEAFLHFHQQYTDDESRYQQESEVSLIDNLNHDLVHKLKENGHYFQLDDFRQLSIDLSIAINSIRRDCESNVWFVQRIKEHMQKQLTYLADFARMIDTSAVKPIPN